MSNSHSYLFFSNFIDSEIMMQCYKDCPLNTKAITFNNLMLSIWAQPCFIFCLWLRTVWVWQTSSLCSSASCRFVFNLLQEGKGLMDQPKFTSHMRSISNDFFCHIEINYFMSPNMQIILLNERCLTSQIQLICKCKWGFICDILYGWEKTKRLLNSNTNCSDWLSHIIIHSESSKYQNSDKNSHVLTVRCIYLSLFINLVLSCYGMMTPAFWKGGWIH